MLELQATGPAHSEQLVPYPSLPLSISMEPGILQPEKKLMFAILLDAVECFQEYGEQDPFFKDAAEWIFEDDRDWPLSFINICEAVDMDPTYLRKGLLYWRQSAISKGSTLWPETVLNKDSGKRCA